MSETKVYITTPTKCKNGRIAPITRVHLEKPCPQCHQSMIVEESRKGSIRQRAFKRWRCTDKQCNHSERNEGDIDRIIRAGELDEE